MPTLKSLLSLKKPSRLVASDKDTSTKEVERVARGGSMKLNDKNYCMLTQFHSTSSATKTLVGVLKVGQTLQFQSFGSAPQFLQEGKNGSKGGLDLVVELKDIVGTHAVTSGLFYRHHIVLKVKRNGTVVLYKFAFLKKGGRDRCYTQIVETQTPSLKKLFYDDNSLQLTKLHQLANRIDNIEVGDTVTTGLDSNSSSPTIRKSKANSNLNSNADDRLEIMFQESITLPTTTTPTEATTTPITTSSPSVQPSLSNLKNLGKASLEATTTHYLIELHGLPTQHYTTLTRTFYPVQIKSSSSLQRLSQFLPIKKVPTAQAHYFQLVVQNKVYDLEETLLTCQPTNSFSSSIKFTASDGLKFIQTTYRFDPSDRNDDNKLKCKLRIAFTNDATISKTFLATLLTCKLDRLPKINPTVPVSRPLPTTRFTFPTRTVSCPVLPTSIAASNEPTRLNFNSKSNLASTSTQLLVKKTRNNWNEHQFHKLTCFTLGTLLLLVSLFLWRQISNLEQEVFGL